MKYIGKLIFTSTLVAAFMVGSIVYWASLGITAVGIWLMAIVYICIFKTVKTIHSFITLLFSRSSWISKTLKNLAS